MRLIILTLLAVVCGGCKTAQFALFYPTSGIRVVARFEAKDELPDSIALQPRIEQRHE